VLRALELESFAKLSGGKGVHVVVPIAPQRGWDEVKGFAHAVALRMVEAEPQRYESVMTKARRVKKIFVDYLRNGRGATAVAAYSSRARPTAAVAAPVAWEELTPRMKADAFTVRTLPQRMAKLRADPWKGYATLRQPLTDAAMRAVGMEVARRARRG